MRWFVLFPQERCRPYGHAVSEQATACGNVGWRQEEPLCATQGRTFDKNENFEVVSFSSILIGRVCPSSNLGAICGGE